MAHPIGEVVDAIFDSGGDEMGCNEIQAHEIVSSGMLDLFAKERLKVTYTWTRVLAQKHALCQSLAFLQWSLFDITNVKGSSRSRNRVGSLCKN